MSKGKVVAHNLIAMNTNRAFGIVTAQMNGSIEKLSSGYRINRAADDAAGLSISEKMRRQIRGLNQAALNAQDGVSLCQIADGALEEVHAMIDRAQELTIKAANGTLSGSDREDINKELYALQDEIDRVHTTTKFNELYIFPKNGLNIAEEISSDKDLAPVMELSMNIGDTPVNITFSFIGNDGAKASIQGIRERSGADVSRSDFSNFVVSAAADAVFNLSQKYPNLFAAASTGGISVGLELGDIDGSGNTLAYAQLRFGASSSETVMGYTMRIDTSDYNPSTFASASDTSKADLAATIAHEMTHLVMYDTLTKGMLTGKDSSFPKWFIEGTAQTSSGDNGWVSYQLRPTASADEIKSYMSELQTMEYGAGYLAAMYLGHAASGSSTITSASIAQGLDKIFTDVANGKYLSDAIKDNTSYRGLGDFEQKFSNGEAAAVNFVHDLLQLRGTSGAGSLFGSLSDSEAAIFAPSSLTSTHANYKINPTAGYIEYSLNKGYDFPSSGPIYRGEFDNESDLHLHVGSEAFGDNKILLPRYNIASKLLFDIGSAAGTAGDSTTDYALNVSTVDGATKGISQVSLASKRISYIRSAYGALQNRLEHTIKNLNNVAENTASAESLIRDLDMAAEMVNYSKQNILQQVGQSMMAQANNSAQGVLSLLQ